MDANIIYTHSEEIHNTKAAEIIVPLILEIIPTASVLDVGCGTGTWLNIFEKFGINDIMGIDGKYVDSKNLLIDNRCFKALDLTKPFNENRKYDLVICLEVAEHLPKTSVQGFVNSLCQHSQHIIFSAAIPGQGGQNHINEQWPSFWEVEFNKNDFFRSDVIRHKIWNNDNVDIWYRQNIFLFSKKSALIKIGNNSPVAEIHPEFWKRKIDEINYLKYEVASFDKGKAGIGRSFIAFINSLINKISAI